MPSLQRCPYNTWPTVYGTLCQMYMLHPRVSIGTLTRTPLLRLQYTRLPSNRSSKLLFQSVRGWCRSGICPRLSNDACVIVLLCRCSRLSSGVRVLCVRVILRLGRCESRNIVARGVTGRILVGILLWRIVRVIGGRVTVIMRLLALRHPIALFLVGIVRTRLVGIVGDSSFFGSYWLVGALRVLFLRYKCFYPLAEDEAQT